MSKNKGKWWLAIVVVCCLAPGAFAKQDKRCDHDRDDPRNCRYAVPEGGTSAVYLLGAGLTCCGAMFLRSRLARPVQS